MKIIYHPKEISFSRLFKRYKLNPSDETTLFLLPGVRVVQEIENRYCGEGVWGKNLLTFKELSDFINETSPNLKKKRISQVQALSVIRKAAEQVSKKLVVFGEFSRNRDFLSSALSIISKLKQNEVTPSEFLRVVKKTKDKNLRLKFADIALLYEKYEALITEKDFLDDSDSVRAVSEEINKMGLREFFPKAKKLVVFGFSDFSLCELSVIKSFFSELPEMFFFVSDFEDLTEYRNCFLRRFNELSIVYEEDRTIMNEDLGPEKKKEFSEFRDSLEEVEYVSRQIKKLIVDDGAHASDFKVLVRSSEKRGGSVANIFEKNGIAVDIGNLQSLGESVYGRLAMDILRLKSGNFHRKDLFRLLHNPLFAFYLGNDERQRRCVNEIKKISSEKGRYRTVSGIAGWRAILKHLARENESLSSVTGDIQNAIDLISSKFGARSFSALTTDLRKVLSELKVEKNSVEHIKREETTRVCFDEFFSLLRELSFPYGGFDFKISDLKEYILLFSQFMGQRSVSYKTPCDEDSKRVSVIDFSATRGIDAKFIFLMGLSDTCFPRPRFNDFLLKPREKIEINKAVKKRVFDWDSLHYERERHLFHTLGSSASQKTFFSCFRYDYGSKEIGRCDFLGEMKNVGTQQNPKSLFELAVSKEDVLFNCILSLQRKRGISDSKMFELLRLKYGSDISKYLINGISAERERLKLTGNYTSFEGVLNRALPINFDSFSPSRLETYGTCPFKYFSQKVLKFDRCEEPEEGGATQLDLGSLAHKILKELMETVFADGSDGPPEISHVLKIYEEIKKKYETNHYAFSHLSKSLMEMEEKRFFDSVLRNFISDEVQRIVKDELIPKYFEREIEFDIGDYKIKGFIDRVDVRKDSLDIQENDVRATVVDYKIGSVRNKKYFDYKNLQLPLYLKALAEKGMTVSSGCYISIGKSGEIKSSGKNFLENTDEAVSLAEYYVKSIKNGFFPPYVGKKDENEQEHRLSMSQDGPCPHCDYRDLCRVKNGVTRSTEI